MGGWTGIWQWVVVLAIILILFGGKGKISALMGDFGKGLKSFKKGLKSEDGEAKGEDAKGEDAKALKSDPSDVASSATESKTEKNNTAGN